MAPKVLLSRVIGTSASHVTTAASKATYGYQAEGIRLCTVEEIIRPDGTTDMNALNDYGSNLSLRQGINQFDPGGPSDFVESWSISITRSSRLCRSFRVSKATSAGSAPYHDQRSLPFGARARTCPPAAARPSRPCRRCQAALPSTPTNTATRTRTPASHAHSYAEHDAHAYGDAKLC